ncbi:MAG: glycosyltransferase family 2 protein [Verrucomicrobiota bacterium]|nr:glycosyltransferase family 2 protein [Verrucomicrobiota bacterium]
MIPISAYMITYNNERTVENALKSLSWADEIVVVDSFSSDKTPEIAKKYADNFSQQKFLGHQRQYQSAAIKCKNEWRFFLDADEVMNKDMIAGIKRLAESTLKDKNNKTMGFLGNRITFYIDRWIKHGGWLPDAELRLYHKSSGDWTPGLHSALAVKGDTSALEGEILHYTYENIADQIATINKYSQIAAEENYENGKKTNAIYMGLSPVWRFFRDYIIKQGFRDGFPGFVIAVNTMMHVFNKHAKLKELYMKNKK